MFTLCWQQIETFTLLSLRCATKQQTSANEGLGSVDPQLERQVETIRNLVDSYMKVWPNTQSFPVGFSYKVNNMSAGVNILAWNHKLFPKGIFQDKKLFPQDIFSKFDNCSALLGNCIHYPPSMF